jgi:hypothetical protein
MDWSKLKPGLYRVWWEAGGSSLAAVGMGPDGSRWIAPTNWQRPVAVTDGAPWADVVRMDPIQIDASNGRAVDWVEHIRRARDLLSTVLDEGAE